MMYTAAHAEKTGVLVLPDAGAVAREAANRFSHLSREAVAEGRPFAAALSGGSTPRAMYALLAGHPFRERIPWAEVHLFWGDERAVPPDNSQSNYRMVCETLLDHVPIPPANIHRIQAERPAVDAAVHYEREIRRFFDEAGLPFPRFDLILLGMGADGHTASLFPDTAALNETGHWVIANYVPQQQSWRITVTFPVINEARHLLFLVTGEKKAGRIRDILQPSARPVLPAQRIRPTNGTLTWLLDRAAASRLTAGGNTGNG